MQQLKYIKVFNCSISSACTRVFLECLHAGTAVSVCVYYCSVRVCLLLQYI
jgi:hypothetical protein